LTPGGIAWFIGAGGPMGQMHLQRAIGLPHPPRKIVATQNTGPRFEDLRERFAALAQQRGIELVLLNPREMTEERLDARLREAGEPRHPSAASPALGVPWVPGRAADSGGGFNDIVCLVPSLPTLERAGEFLAPGGGVNLFAGVPVGTTARLDLAPIVSNGARYWGTSGSSIADLRHTVEKLSAGELATDGVVAAVSGIRGVRDGLAAVSEGRFLGKTVIYPQLETLPLLSIAEVAARFPTVGERLTRGKYWNRDAEAELLRVVAGA
jgi:threonine dehydrogenase-like Zn-dependent dehydrogenase